MSRTYQKETTQRAINQALNQLTKKHPELEKEIDQTQQQILNEIENSTITIIMTPAIKQRFHEHMGIQLVLRDMRREWGYYKAITQIMVDPQIQNILQKTYKQNYEELLRRINQYGTQLNLLKYHLEQQDKTRRNTELYSHHEKKILDLLLKTPLFFPDLDKIFITINNNTNLGHMTVPAVVISRLKNEYKKVEYPEEKTKNKNPTQTEGGET